MYTCTVMSNNGTQLCGLNAGTNELSCDKEAQGLF